MNSRLLLTLSAVAGLTACGGGEADQNRQQGEQGNTTVFPEQGAYDEPATANLTTDSAPSGVDAAVNQVDDANELNTLR
jgi:hypothetical protein